MFSPSLALSRQALKQCCKVGPYQNEGMRVYDSKYGPRYTLPGTNENLQEATGTCDMMHSYHLPCVRDKTKAGTEREGAVPVDNREVEGLGLRRSVTEGRKSRHARDHGIPRSGLGVRRCPTLL